MASNKNILTKLSAILVFLGTQFLFSSISVNAKNSPTLSMKDTVVTDEDLDETNNIGVDLILTNNNGFLASSFGIKYDDRLEYTDFISHSKIGDAFEVFCNEDENLIWFCAAGGTQSDTITSGEDNFLSVYFNIPENIENGIFELNFIWTGLDGSQAYWYTDKETDLIKKIIEKSNNGKIICHGLHHKASDIKNIRMNLNEKSKLEILNTGTETLWFSNDMKVATVDQDGLVHAISAGTCMIYAYSNNHISTYIITISDKYYYSMEDDSRLRLTDNNVNAILEIPEVSDKITWISFNPDIIRVDDDGTIHAFKNGKADILAISNGKTYIKVIEVDLTKFKSKFIPGDIDKNGKLEICDVVYGNRIIVGVEKPTSEQIEIGDLNNNKKIDLSDTMSILRKLVGLD